MKVKLGDLFIFVKEIASYIRLYIGDNKGINLGILYTNAPADSIKLERPYVDQLGIRLRTQETKVVNNLWPYVLEKADREVFPRRAGVDR